MTSIQPRTKTVPPVDRIPPSRTVPRPTLPRTGAVLVCLGPPVRWFPRSAPWALHVQVPTFVASTVMSICVALCIDYALFLCARYNEAFKLGNSNSESVWQVCICHRDAAQTEGLGVMGSRPTAGEELPDVRAPERVHTIL